MDIFSFKYTWIKWKSNTYMFHSVKKRERERSKSVFCEGKEVVTSFQVKKNVHVFVYLKTW